MNCGCKAHFAPRWQNSVEHCHRHSEENVARLEAEAAEERDTLRASLDALRTAAVAARKWWCDPISKTEEDAITAFDIAIERSREP